MANLYSGRVINVGLRSATLVSRLLFVFFLAKYLDTSSVGYYGLFTASIGYVLYFVGLDFYNYVTREILKAHNEERGRMLKGQAALSGVLYVLLLPFALLFFPHSGWPDQLLWWFFPILFLEHLNQEITRLLIAFSKQITASLILFVRQSSWAIASVLFMNFYTGSRNLETVVALWATAGVVAALIGIWKLRQLDIGGWQSSVDWLWVKKGIGISGAFLIATLALRGINTIDRYWIEALGDIHMVAAYVLLFGVAGTVMTFLDAGIFAYAYPALIHHEHKHEFTQAQARVRLVLWQTVIVVGAFALVSWLLLPYLLHWIGNTAYLEAANLYPWILLATGLNALGMAPNYGLYARGHDKPIIASHCASLVVFVLSTWLLRDHYGLMAVLLGLNLAFALILVWKSLAYWQPMCKTLMQKTDGYKK
jgi:O-antigen/teichoic acid export membrane protein